MSNNLLQFYTSFKGRVNRRDFILKFFLVSVLGSLIARGLDIFLKYNGLSLYGINIFSSIWTLIFIVPGFAVTCKRMHDFNYSGWWQMAPQIFLIIMLIVLYIFPKIGIDMSLVMLICMILGGIACIWVLSLMLMVFFRKGTNGSNQYGPDPLKMITIEKTI